MSEISRGENYGKLSEIVGDIGGIRIVQQNQEGMIPDNDVLIKKLVTRVEINLKQK